MGYFVETKRVPSYSDTTICVETKESFYASLANKGIIYSFARDVHFDKGDIYFNNDPIVTLHQIFSWEAGTLILGYTRDIVAYKGTHLFGFSV